MVRPSLYIRIALACLLALPTLAFAQQFSDWSSPTNLGGPVNSALEETDPFISKDGLSLYFTCAWSGHPEGCPGSLGGADIYVAQRTTIYDPWGSPQNLGPAVNTPYEEAGAALSPDEHRLYFNSNRPGGQGNSDLYVARRPNRRDDLGWRPAENLGVGVNTTANERFSGLFEDDATGVLYLYFASDRPGGMGGDDLYRASLQNDETFGDAILVTELSSESEDRHPALRRDGLEIFFMSNRPRSTPNAKGLPSFDLWTSTRASTADPWSEAVNVGPAVNGPTHDGRPAISFDGTQLYFFSARAANPFSGLMDIWMAERLRVGDEP